MAQRERKLSCPVHQAESKRRSDGSCDNPGFRNPEIRMDIVKLGKKGQVSLPAGVLRELGLTGSATLLVETTADGAVLLRPAAVYPVEHYSDERLREFEQGNRSTAVEDAKIAKALKRRKR